ncbi:MAG TPA: adenylate/guanylate cyclase domain-containing protein [Euzebyales bacterium]|nr:adenylate/guanylate cyclase domain-containing protein [Euzebyales bacterium]
MAGHAITVFLAEDNLLVREGVQALLSVEHDIAVVGVASDYDELIAAAEAAAPQVLVTDIRMPPTFRREGIEAAQALRKRHPGTGVVILSQYDDPSYAVALLRESAAGVAYLLKDRVAEGDQLVRAIREVAAGGSMLDPKIVHALVEPVRDEGDLTADEQELLEAVAAGKPIKAIAVSRQTTPADIAADIERLFVRLAEGLSAGSAASLERLKSLQQAIVQREEQGETLLRLLPGGLAEKLRAEGRRIGETESLQVTVLMSDVRGYSAIAERTSPSALARQLNEHRAQMNRAVLAHGGTVMQFVGDAVMAVFGAPTAQPDHADHAVAAARDMHRAQATINARWSAEGLEPFPLGIGLSTGEVAAALLGSEERMEYSLVGDTVNLAQRLQQLADAGQTVLSGPTHEALSAPVAAEALEPQLVKGRRTAVHAWRIGRETDAPIDLTTPEPVVWGT